MFDIPERYLVNSPIKNDNFIQRDTKRADRAKIKENLLSARLVWQLAGEDIPSRIDETHNCAVIMGLDINIKNIKDAAYFAEQFQPLFKGLCVIRFYDASAEAFSFAIKRLNLHDKSQIVTEDKVITQTAKTTLPDKPAAMLREHLSFNALKNKCDKLCLYTEAAVKAFIISNLRLYSGLARLIEGNLKLWYNYEDTLSAFEMVKDLQEMKTALDAEKLPGEKAKIMTKIKAAYTRIDAFA